MLARAAARHRGLLAKPGRVACLGPRPDRWPRAQVNRSRRRPPTAR